MLPLTCNLKLNIDRYWIQRQTNQKWKLHDVDNWVCVMCLLSIFLTVDVIACEQLLAKDISNDCSYVCWTIIVSIYLFNQSHIDIASFQLLARSLSHFLSLSLSLLSSTGHEKRTNFMARLSLWSIKCPKCVFPFAVVVFVF